MIGTRIIRDDFKSELYYDSNSHYHVSTPYADIYVFYHHPTGWIIREEEILRQITNGTAEYFFTEKWNEKNK